MKAEMNWMPFRVAKLSSTTDTTECDGGFEELFNSSSNSI